MQKINDVTVAVLLQNESEFFSPISLFLPFKKLIAGIWGHLHPEKPILCPAQMGSQVILCPDGRLQCLMGIRTV